MISLLLKATLVFAAGWLIARLLHQRSASLRHVVWTATLGASLGLALLSPLVPRLPIAFPAVARAESVWGSRGVVTTYAVNQLVTQNTEISRAAEPRPATHVTRSISQWLALGWLAGFLAVAGWCLLGRLGLARVLRRATPLHDPACPVRLFVSPQLGSPATWGMRRPVIVLPPAALEWTAERRQVVLEHELAHIARGDSLANLIGWTATALYWFHPLAWLAARRLRAEAERAADDFVLARGVAPVEYAAHLLEVARGARLMRLLGANAIGMARPHTLEGRLLAVLDDTRDRKVPKLLTRRATWTAFAVLALPLASLTPAPVQPELGVIRQHVDSLSFPARQGDRLTLDLKTGASVRIEGWDEPRVWIRVSLGGADWRDTRVVMKPQEGGIRVVTTQHTSRSESSTNHRFDIKVPRRYDVQLESAGGGVSIVGVEGTFNGDTGGGEVTLERARGRVMLGTGGGDVQVSDSELDGQVTTGGGTVRMSRVTGGLRGSSGSGPVSVNQHKAGSTGAVHIEKAGGKIDLEQAPNGAEVQTGGGDIRIGGGAGQVSAKTGGGNITIGPIDGSIEASTGAGTLQVRITNPAGSVELGTGKGDAIVELPRGFTGRFELETAYTRRHGRTRISSDWELEHSETDEWDATQGTPRRYVRASGKAGNGLGVIRISIVNGNITVKQKQ